MPNHTQTMGKSKFTGRFLSWNTDVLETRSIFVLIRRKRSWEIGKVAKREYPPCTGHRPYAINDFTAGVYNTVTKEYHSIQFQGAFEIVSLTGTVTRKDGDVYLHLHIAAGDEEGLVHGGHLNRAIISATAEIQIR